jgi:hypothetical protein
VQPLPAPRGIDWAQFLRLARFHRVQGLAARALGDGAATLPHDVASALASDARDIAARSLQATNASARLQRAFAEAGIDLLFVKGLTLAARIYRTASTKAAVDIDLLIHEHDLDGAAALLSAQGYQLVSPVQPKNLAAVHRLRKESAWLHRGLRVQVDLHTRLSDNPRLISDIGMASPRQEIEVAPGILLPTLGDEHLLTYLAVHGASSAWFRLKWITDFAALLDAMKRPAAELHRHAQELGAGRAIDQALLVADALFGSLGAEPALRSRLERGTANRRLAATALGYLSRAQPREPTGSLFGTGPIHISQFLLGRGIGYKRSELLRQARAVLLR